MTAVDRERRMFMTVIFNKLEMIVNTVRPGCERDDSGRPERI